MLNEKQLIIISVKNQFNWNQFSNAQPNIS